MKISPALLKDAETVLRGYLKANPKGEYFFSSRGLLDVTPVFSSSWS